MAILKLQNNFYSPSHFLLHDHFSSSGALACYHYTHKGPFYPPAGEVFLAVRLGSPVKSQGKRAGPDEKSGKKAHCSRGGIMLP